MGEMMQQFIDNIQYMLKEELIQKIKAGNRVLLVAAYFSMYAYRIKIKETVGGFING